MKVIATIINLFSLLCVILAMLMLVAHLKHLIQYLRSINLFKMFQSLFSFNGRIRRTEFGISFIIYLIIAIPLRFSENAMLQFTYIPLIWFLWSQGAKRCHDLGKNGFWQLIPFYVFWMLLENGQFGENEYGDNPKGEIDPFINYGVNDNLFNPDKTDSFTTEQMDSFTAKPKE